MTSEEMNQRVMLLEASLSRIRRLGAAALAPSLAVLVYACATPSQARVDRPRELVVSKLTVVDETGTRRIVLGPDTVGAGRRSHAAGVTLYDRTGAERGGFGTMEDGSVTLAMDAPVGVGSAMRDRLGMMVTPDGTAQVLLIDNQTQGQVRLTSNAEGEGAVQLFRWEPDKIHIRSLTFSGDRRTTQPKN